MNGMTIERAAELLQEWLDCDRRELGGKIESDYDRFVAERDEAVEVALEALKYRKKMLPADGLTPDGHIFYKSCCPRCDNELDHWGVKFCGECGQKLEWGYENETGDEI